ncbi:MAG: YARHG domain-containing protein [Bacteroidetes bacterium]|nr:YARHG domain-containing protein [Bacteroidota bacterium]
MTKYFLIFIFLTWTFASCKCNDKQVNDRNTAAASANNNTGSQNLKAMSEAANSQDINKTPDEPGEEAMNKMYGTSAAAREAMGKRNELRKSGKLMAGYYPEGSQRRLTDDDIKFLSPWGHEVMLNEIYARHGMIFKDEQLKRHFASQGWYHPESANVYQKLSGIEKQNIAFLINTSKEGEQESKNVASNQ